MILLFIYRFQLSSRRNLSAF